MLLRPLLIYLRDEFCNRDILGAFLGGDLTHDQPLQLLAALAAKRFPLPIYFLLTCHESEKTSDA